MLFLLPSGELAGFWSFAYQNVAAALETLLAWSSQTIYVGEWRTICPSQLRPRELPRETELSPERQPRVRLGIWAWIPLGIHWVRTLLFRLARLTVVFSCSWLSWAPGRTWGWLCCWNGSRQRGETTELVNAQQCSSYTNPVLWQRLTPSAELFSGNFLEAGHWSHSSIHCCVT